MAFQNDIVFGETFLRNLLRFILVKLTQLNIQTSIVPRRVPRIIGTINTMVRRAFFRCD